MRGYIEWTGGNKHSISRRTCMVTSSGRVEINTAYQEEHAVTSSGRVEINTAYQEEHAWLHRVDRWK